VTVIFERPVDPARLKRRDFFVLDLSGNARGRSDIWFYFWAGEKRWFAHSYDPQTKKVGYGGSWVTRLSPRGFKITVPYVEEVYFDSITGGYRFRLASFSRTGPGCGSGCWDAIPNRGWLVHDWAAPFVERWQVPYYSLPASDIPGVPVVFRVVDRGFSGLRKWKLSKKIPGTDDWKTVHDGRSEELVRRLVPGEQGQKLLVRLEASDRTGHVMPSRVERTIIPYDDSNQEAGGTFIGGWSEQEESASYLRRLHVSSTPLDTFQFTASARTYCSYRDVPEHGQATYRIGNRSMAVDISSGVPGPHGTQCLDFETEAIRTAIVEVAEGTINVDGYWYD